MSVVPPLRFGDSLAQGEAFLPKYFRGRVELITDEAHMDAVERATEQYAEELKRTWDGIETKAGRYLAAYTVLATWVGTNIVFRAQPIADGGLLAKLLYSLFLVVGTVGTYRAFCAMRVDTVSVVSHAVILEPTSDFLDDLKPGEFSALSGRQWLLEHRWRQLEIAYRRGDAKAVHLFAADNAYAVALGFLACSAVVGLAGC